MITLYHNPHCSKSREAHQWLSEHNIPFQTVLYLQNPLNQDELCRLAQALGLDSVRDMMRSKEKVYQELNLHDADEPTLFNALVEHPILLERPIVLIKQHAAIGRPLSQIQQLIEQFY